MFLLKELRIYELLFCERIVDRWIVGELLDAAFPRMPFLRELIQQVKTEKGLDDVPFAGLTAQMKRTVEDDYVLGVKVLLGDFATAKASLVCGGGDM